MPHRCVNVTGRASPWRTTLHAIDHTILTSILMTKTQPVVEEHHTSLDNQPEQIIRKIPSHCFFPITTVNRIRTNTSLPCGKTEDLPPRYESWRALWRLQPYQFWSLCFLLMPHATSSPPSKLQVPPFFRLRPQRCSRIPRN